MSSIRQPSGDHHKYTSDALRSARETVLDGDELRRSYPRPLAATRVIVLVTGGPSDDPRTTATQAAAAREDGVYIIVVGVGPFVSRQEVQSIVGQPWSSFAFLVQDASNLSRVAEQLAARICERKLLSLFTSSSTTIGCIVCSGMPPGRPAVVRLSVVR